MIAGDRTRKKSGSNNRYRQLLLGARVSEQEMAAVQAAAQQQNQSVASFVRNTVLRAATG